MNATEVAAWFVRIGNCLAKRSYSISFNISNIAADLLELFLKLLKASLGLDGLHMHMHT